MLRPHKTHLLAAFSLSIAIAVVIVLYDRLFEAPANISQKQTPSTSQNGEVYIAVTPSMKIPAIREDYTKSHSQWIIVSKSLPLPDQNYQPDDLEVPPVPANSEKSREEQSLRKLISIPLTDMLKKASYHGYDLFVASGYRSYNLQKQYYDSYVGTGGEAEANMFSAKPGQSEHQTGLAFDLSLRSRECYLEICFGNTDAGKWLKTHAHQYGFIVRYPENKTSVTGYQYEPWHFRYVGRELATALYESNMTLDEIAPQLRVALSELRTKKLITE